ncbi:MAG: GH3 auxin-responsive promoter family protein [Dehalococcoidales bacterium]
MPKAADLLRQGRNEELWEMCCGFIGLDIDRFMTIQKRLLLEQMELLSHSPLGKKIMRGARPRTVAEFREKVPLTTYADYCPELLEKKEAPLPAEPAQWVRTSGRSGEYLCRWIPVTPAYVRQMSLIMYGLGNLASCREWGDTSRIPTRPRLVYTVAPKPYMSGALAGMLGEQTPIDFLPSLEEAEKLSFEDRVKLGFKEALSQGMDYFFGLSLVLVTIGNKFSESSNKVSLRPLLRQPRALLRLIRGLVKSKLARRPMLPRDLWHVKGIISSGLDSWVYRDKIKELWGRYPLDVYASTEGGIIATQTWDYDSMTFIPNLNFLEFIPEKEHFKGQLDPDYQPKTLLLDEVTPDENYELVITNFHGGALARYRIGDMVKITSLRNDRLGIELPQMVFERRADGLLNFVVLQLTEKQIWQAIENTGHAYEDWTAYKNPGEPVLHLLVEPGNSYRGSAADMAAAVQAQILGQGNNGHTPAAVLDDLTDMIDFSVEVELLAPGAFARYTARRQAEGADLAHLKPPHLNASDKILALLLGKPEAAVAAPVEAEREPVAVP